MNASQKITGLFVAGFILISAPSVPFAETSAKAPIQAHQIELGYNVYAGGFKALKASLELDMGAQDYEVNLEAETQGFIGNLFPWKGNYSTTGLTDKEGNLQPGSHQSESNWKNKISKTELEYTEDGQFKEKRSQKGNRKTTTQKDINKKLTQDTVDVLTGTIEMLKHVEFNNTCEGDIPVFDGKRRFNLTFEEKGIDTLSKSKYSKFFGEALKCIIKVEPVAGFKKKDKKRGWMAVQNHTEKRKKPPTIWLAALEEDGPVVPVRMEIASDYGTVIMHLVTTKTDFDKQAQLTNR